MREAKSHDGFEYEILSVSLKKTLKTLENSIKSVERQLEELIRAHSEINESKELLTSIPGIGNQCAIHFIIATNNFRGFQDARHLACYAGVVPFKNRSGAITKKEKISKMANQKLKKLLHLSAMASVRSDSELKQYFHRKVEEGKNKMSVFECGKKQAGPQNHGCNPKKTAIFTKRLALHVAPY